MKLRRPIVVREGTCNVCGRPERVAGWNVEGQATPRRSMSLRAELCSACATCLVNVLGTFKTYMGPSS